MTWRGPSRIAPANQQAKQEVADTAIIDEEYHVLLKDESSTRHCDTHELEELNISDKRCSRVAIKGCLCAQKLLADHGRCGDVSRRAAIQWETRPGAVRGHNTTIRAVWDFAIKDIVLAEIEAAVANRSSASRYDG